jgi:outer membrane protein OmpA-like peptidoglycan-associated protein
MNRVGLAWVVSVGSLSFAHTLWAQPGGEPPPSVPPAPPEAPPEAPPAPPEATPPSEAPPAPIAPLNQPGAPPPAESEPPAEEKTVREEAPAEEFDPTANDRSSRRASLRVQNSINASTGLLYVPQAGSGLPGTFRLSLLTKYYSGTGFLCNSESICPSFDGQDVEEEDELSHVSAHLGLSATLFPALEVFLGIHNHATSNSRSRPRLLQVLGDANLGVKAFTPWTPDQILFFGGEAELMLLNGTGGVGLDGSGTSFAFRGLLTVDPSNREKAEDRTPLRAHVKVGYKVDRSAKLVEDLESAEPPEGRGGSITRVERFGLGISRVDSFEFGFAAEYVHPIVRPFLGWTIDVPVNRQSYVCDIEASADRGEDCLGEVAQFSVAPSRLSLGANVMPWQGRGLNLLAAFDIGTGATSLFVDEVKPELPWGFWFGLGYAIDTQPPPPPKVIVERAPAPPVRDQVLQGVVVEKGSLTAIPNAIVRYEGVRLTGMVTDETGTFVTAPLPPGPYTFSVSAKNYKDAQCTATVGPAPTTPEPAKPDDSPIPGMPDPLVPPKAAASSRAAQVQCELDKQPRVGNLIATLVDAESYAPVGGARVRITDRLGRELVLEGDASGVFRFENISPGPVKLTIEGPGYLTSVTELVVKEHDELQSRIPLNRRPKQPNVTLQGANIKLKRPILFQTGAAAIAPESLAIVEEVAEFMKNSPELALEVQGHTDNAGTPLTNQTLSQNRAQAVADALTRLGVDASRLTVKGYGDAKPLAPNTTEANRAKNNRVQLVVRK